MDKTIDEKIDQTIAQTINSLYGSLALISLGYSGTLPHQFYTIPSKYLIIQREFKAL